MKFNLMIRSKDLIEQMRPKHWVKNTLVLVPLIASHQIFDLEKLVDALIFIMCFSFLASAAYTFNDIRDIDSDKAHDQKKFRPLASGRISTKQAYLMFFILVSIVSSVAFTVFSVLANLVLFFYFVLTLTYSIQIKKYFGLDVVTLSLLYTLRILGGTFATEVSVSYWLLTFSIFIFFSLGNMKRYIEILNSKNPTIPGRGYSKSDESLVLMAGLSSGLISVLVSVLYVQNPEISNLYAHPDLLFLCSIILLHWVIFSWHSASHNKVFYDPIIWAVKDKTSLLSFFFILCFTLIAAS